MTYFPGNKKKVGLLLAFLFSMATLVSASPWDAPCGPRSSSWPS